MIAQYAKAPELLEQKENVMGKDGKVDMCKALNELVANGEARGEARMNSLFANLMNENRFDDMQKATRFSVLNFLFSRIFFEGMVMNDGYCCVYQTFRHGTGS